MLYLTSVNLSFASKLLFKSEELTNFCSISKSVSLNWQRSSYERPWSCLTHSAVLSPVTMAGGSCVKSQFFAQLPQQVSPRMSRLCLCPAHLHLRCARGAVQRSAAGACRKLGRTGSSGGWKCNRNRTDTVWAFSVRQVRELLKQRLHLGMSHFYAF